MGVTINYGLAKYPQKGTQGPLGLALENGVVARCVPASRLSLLWVPELALKGSMRVPIGFL